VLDARGVTVTIVGTGISTTADNQGQFTLNNVPSDALQLNFTGPGPMQRSRDRHRAEHWDSAVVNGNSTSIQIIPRPTTTSVNSPAGLPRLIRPRSLSRSRD
jgi:hypothetical protein